jgi:hypothetical protein
MIAIYLSALRDYDMIHARFIAAFALMCAGPALAHPEDNGDTQASNPDKIICKRMVETGSLVRGKRTCKTRATWDSEAQAARRQVQEMQDSSLINSHRPE